MQTRSQSKELDTSQDTLSVPPKKLKKPKSKKKKNKYGKLDHNRPRKPPTAFFYFLDHFKKTYKKEYPHIRSMRDIGKACGEKWKTMAFDDKVAYFDIATEKRAEFEKAMAEYLKKKELEYLEKKEKKESGPKRASKVRFLAAKRAREDSRSCVQT